MNQFLFTSGDNFGTWNLGKSSKVSKDPDFSLFRKKL